jgi:hypothetical protein
MKPKTGKPHAPTKPKPAPVEPTIAPPPDSRIARWQLVTLLAILLAAAAARWYRISEFSLWLDEIWAIETATGRGSPHAHLPQGVIIAPAPDFTSLDGAPPWWRIWTGMGNVTHPPLYVILLRWWMDAFGTGAAAVRSLSAIASVVAVALMFDVVRILRGTNAALWAAALMALTATQVQFAQDARPYALMAALALAATAALVRIERSGATAWRLAAFAASLLALMLTHYFAIGAATAIVAHGVLRTKGRDRRRLLQTTAIAATAFAMVWGPFMWSSRSTFADVNTDFLRYDAPGHFMRTLGRLAITPPRLISDFFRVNAAAVGTGVICVVAAYRARRHDDLLLWTTWLGATLGLVFLLDLTRGTQHLDHLRYTYLASPAMCGIIATLTWDVRGWQRYVLPSLVLIGSLLILPDAATTFWKANWRDVSQKVQSHTRPGDVLVFAGNTETSARNAYLCLSHFMPHDRRPAVALVARRADPALVAQLKAAPGVILVTDILSVRPHKDVFGECDEEFLASAPGVGDVMRVTWPRAQQ